MIPRQTPWAVALVAGAALAGAAAAAAAVAAPGGTDASSYAEVRAGAPLAFPGDYGSHPQFRTEWWYVTGWLSSERGESLGFQVTFFRTRPRIDDNNPSAFTPHQILIAHGAVSDPQHGRLWQDQRIRREGFGLAEAGAGDTHLRLDGWSLQRNAAGDYSAAIDAEDFSLDLALAPTQAALLNGDSGFSRKGPAAQAASYYYSLPHLRVSGILGRQGGKETVSGEAWLDHEWSSEYLDAESVGWDWIGINLDDGGALMAFRIRGADGLSRWAGGTLRNGTGQLQILRPADVQFSAGRLWTSPRTHIAYPVQWRIRAGQREFDLEPLLDDQENDTRLTTGAIYWEGAVRAFERRRPVGRGYLELTGYGERLRLR